MQPGKKSYKTVNNPQCFTVTAFSLERPVTEVYSSIPSRRKAMLNNDPALESLVSSIQGTTEFLSVLISRKSGLILILVVSAAVVLKAVLS